MIDLPTSWGTRSEGTEAAVREVAEKTLGTVRVALRDDMAVLDAIAAFHAALEERFAKPEGAAAAVFTEAFAETSARAGKDLLWEAGTRADPNIAWHLARHGLHRAQRAAAEAPEGVGEQVRAGLLGEGKARVDGLGTFDVRQRPGFVLVGYTPHGGERAALLGDARVVEVRDVGIFTRRGDSEAVDFAPAEALLRDVREKWKPKSA